MTNDDPKILCFQHLKNEIKIFCFEFPRFCKFCNADLLISDLHIPPFRVPYPFKYSSKAINTVVIKPTTGDFLNNYENSSDLHIGVTDSKGFVVEYDVNGLRRTKAHKWNQCLSIKVLQHMTPSVQSYWDHVLYETFTENCWTPARYNAESHNCYSFVLSFLRALQLEELEPHIFDKIVFCKHFVTPQTHLAAKYISVYRKLKKDSV